MSGVGRTDRDRHRTARTRALALVGVVVVLAAGCGEEPARLDRTATQEAVAEVVAARVEPPVASVTCPAEIRQAKGVRTSCRATLEGADDPLRLVVRQVDEEGRLDVVLRDAVIDRGAVAEDLRRTLIDKLKRSFLVDCGEAGPRVVAPPASFTCKARDRSGRRTVRVQVADAAGTLRYAIGA